MYIDTVHLTKGRSLVTIAPTTAEERALSDAAWGWVATNQHRLAWSNDATGFASLRSAPPTGPVPGVKVHRPGDLITVQIRVDD